MSPFFSLCYQLHKHCVSYSYLVSSFVSLRQFKCYKNVLKEKIRHHFDAFAQLRYEVCTDEECTLYEFQLGQSLESKTVAKRSVHPLLRQEWQHLKSGNAWEDYDFRVPPSFEDPRLRKIFYKNFFVEIVFAYIATEYEKYLSSSFNEDHDSWENDDPDELNECKAKGLLGGDFPDLFFEPVVEFWYDGRAPYAVDD